VYASTRTRRCIWRLLRQIRISGCMWPRMGRARSVDERTCSCGWITARAGREDCSVGDVVWRLCLCKKIPAWRNRFARICGEMEKRGRSLTGKTRRKPCLFQSGLWPPLGGKLFNERKCKINSVQKGRDSRKWRRICRHFTMSMQVDQPPGGKEAAISFAPTVARRAPERLAIIVVLL
jgi:hypothetical protein